MRIRNAPEVYYNNIEPKRAAELAEGNVPRNWTTSSQKVTGASWKDLPTTYIYCAQDRAIEPPLPRSMVQDALAAGGSASFDMVTLDSGRYPFLSQPEALCQLIVKAAGRGSQASTLRVQDCSTLTIDGRFNVVYSEIVALLHRLSSESLSLIARQAWQSSTSDPNNSTAMTFCGGECSLDSSSC